MDPQRMKRAYEKLQVLDERLTYKVRSAAGGGGGFSRPGVEQLDERMRHLAEYTVELKEIVAELFVAIGSRPKPPPSS